MYYSNYSRGLVFRSTSNLRIILFFANKYLEDITHGFINAAIFWPFITLSCIFFYLKECFTHLTRKSRIAHSRTAHSNIFYT